MIYSIIAKKARREFSRAMRFAEGGVPHLPPPGDPRPRLLYIHIPFCERLCPYCSFNRFVFAEDLCRAYFQALRKEILLYRGLGYNFGGIYVGGGTPTVLIDELEETIALARESFQIRELSVETNPNHLTEDRLTALQRAGVDRLSVGVQSFDDGLLKKMDRYDKYGSGEAIAGMLRETLGRFRTLNADMIFNFPTQTPAMIDRDCEILTDIGIDQATWYPLMVSDSTRQKVMDTLGHVDFRQEKLYYNQIAGRLVPPYRFSSAWCFSRKQAMIDEYIVDYDEYAGLGSGSIGYLNGTCYANTFDIAGYISRLDRGELPLAASRVFSVKERIRYDFIMKLFGTRLNMTDLRKKYDGAFLSLLGPDLLAFSLIGALAWRSPEIVLTKRGRYAWVVLMREFFTAVNNFRDYCRGRTGA
ncbi:MAG: coproporphyrinogen III oxidase family protein [Proteobacteria bacterium]|nr:coproporphyrinogen III oxidase family protein [Pseudomonadota bacterium]MBU2261941.1 coproporphyrinogen III oxidase family protein [Pseudomonadota bacterium]